MEYIVSCENISKDYKLGNVAIHALKNIDLQIPRKSFVSIVGPSGSGKTTLLNLIGTLDKPTAGKVFISGEDVDRLSDRDLSRFRAKKIGFVFQVFNLIPVLNVYENIEYALLFSKCPKDQIRGRVEQMIENVGLTAQRRQRMNELSGGQRQRVSIARALVIEPDIVLADEPTANLDSRTGLDILKLMRRMNEKLGTTFIFSTHDPKVMDIAEKKYVLQDGEFLAKKGGKKRR